MSSSNLIHRASNKVSDTLLTKIWTPYVRKDCGFTPPHPVWLTIEDDKPGVYCRLVIYQPWYILARFHVSNSFLDSAKKYVNVPLVDGTWKLYTPEQRARARDVQMLLTYASFINSFLA